MLPQVQGPLERGEGNARPGTAKQIPDIQQALPRLHEGRGLGSKEGQVQGQLVHEEQGHAI
eukprot:9743034-Alexandrium_andersonii.AAC.1